jgi:hypothetical protein
MTEQITSETLEIVAEKLRQHYIDLLFKAKVKTKRTALEDLTLEKLAKMAIPITQNTHKLSEDWKLDLVWRENFSKRFKQRHGRDIRWNIKNI